MSLLEIARKMAEASQHIRDVGGLNPTPETDQDKLNKIKDTLCHCKDELVKAIDSAKHIDNVDKVSISQVHDLVLVANQHLETAIDILEKSNK